jgi:hypothetical protein
MHKNSSFLLTKLISSRDCEHRPIARQRLGKHIPAGANARNNMTSIARQRTSKHAFIK